MDDSTLVTGDGSRIPPEVHDRLAEGSRWHSLCHWTVHRSTDAALAFEHERGRTVLEVVPDRDDRPGSEPLTRWKLRCRRSAGEATSTATVDRYTTIDRAVDDLLERVTRLDCEEYARGVPLAEVFGRGGERSG
ncbi:hypothetical protein [Natronorarus salvus]|uniref:hypothetical protein n=1 Tax=Natronorarus salvus TaxID=3117733 RepID=UPI002F26CD3F